MNKKKLEIELSKLKTFNNLNVNLEQYQTESEFASHLLWLAYSNGDIEGKTIADFGCGNGIFGIGALLLGAKFVYFLDIDSNALNICKENLKIHSLKNYELISNDIVNFNKKVDVVLMNPPFGVQNRKADKKFLEVAMKHSNKIYSIHKIGSKNFIEQLSMENKFEVLEIVEREFFIKRTYKFHTKERHGFKVGIWVLKRNI